MNRNPSHTVGDSVLEFAGEGAVGEHPPVCQSCVFHGRVTHYHGRKTVGIFELWICDLVSKEDPSVRVTGYALGVDGIMRQFNPPSFVLSHAKLRWRRDDIGKVQVDTLSALTDFESKLEQSKVVPRRAAS